VQKSKTDAAVESIFFIFCSSLVGIMIGSERLPTSRLDKLS